MKIRDLFAISYIQSNNLYFCSNDKRRYNKKNTTICGSNINLFLFFKKYFTKKYFKTHHHPCALNSVSNNFILVTAWTIFLFSQKEIFTLCNLNIFWMDVCISICTTNKFWFWSTNNSCERIFVKQK